MKTITARLLMVGNELLSGKTIDTNAAMAARALTDIGVEVTSKETLPDILEPIVSAIKRTKEDILLISGGLGPTSDDLTRSAIAKAFNVKLKRDEAQMKRLEDFFTKVKRPFAACNYVQADVPAGFTAINNDFGTAPALFKKKPFVFALPGVPRELEGLLAKVVIPAIKKNFKVPELYTEEVRTTGIGESLLFEKIGYLTDTKGVTFGSLPEIQGVILRFSGRDKKTVKAVADKVRKRCSDFVYGGYGETIAGVLQNIFLKRKESAAFAESCTGGMMSSRIVSIPGSSEWFKGSAVTYSNSAKQKLLGVKAKTLSSKGAVSEETVLEMANGALKAFSSDWSVAISGIAGPTGGTTEKPVGTVCIAVCGPNTQKSTTLKLFGGRDAVRERATAAALFMLYKETTTKK
ncbi:MAG: CinA family nicotinamide mononucleotide deamidase-related protein [Fibrobacteres bacterium]|nr:CinA family nicotinamide mononucleotide deamidase-related protein [Fibrobacterota bacterium]